jgi:gamma-glutamyltranspeptidase/glutathione hydrolase
MANTYGRRDLLKLTTAVLLEAGIGEVVPNLRADPSQAAKHAGCVVGQREAARVGDEVLAAGGNAVDAAVAGALVAGVVAVQHCGIGGYGGHLIIALAGGRKVTAVDFNSAAPASFREDVFPLNKNGEVRDQRNLYGWLAAGVPGTLAGLELALNGYGSLPFDKLVQPAIRFAEEGFTVAAPLATAIRGAQAQIRKDPASARLLLDDRGEPLRAGTTYRNPDLAALLKTLAQRRSTDSFYRGDIAQRIAEAFQKNGGLVTAADLAAYRAREVEPLELAWCGYSVRTAPLTAGGASMLQALAVLKSLGWDNLPAHVPQTTHARLEGLRLTWADRLRVLGDPAKANIPLERLLSESYAKRLAAQVEAAVKGRKALRIGSEGRTTDGTVHLSVADSKGNLVALTLTHGNHFGARVAVAGLGLILGHGMSRFEPRPGHPNSPGPGKRPLHNMCPTVVLRAGHPVLALGGTGGRKIPNAVFDVLSHYVGRGASLEEAIAAPRIHTEGEMAVTMEAEWPDADVDYLKEIGYRVQRGSSATVNAVAFDPDSGASRSVSR